LRDAHAHYHARAICRVPACPPAPKLGGLPSRALPARGGLGAPTGAGGLEYSADPSPLAARLRLLGARAMCGVAVTALAAMLHARATGNITASPWVRGGLAAQAAPAPGAAAAGAAAGAPSKPREV